MFCSWGYSDEIGELARSTHDIASLSQFARESREGLFQDNCVLSCFRVCRVGIRKLAVTRQATGIVYETVLEPQLLLHGEGCSTLFR